MTNEAFFNCSIDSSCDQGIGYTKTNLGRIFFILISILGIISNSIIIIYNFTKKNKLKRRKALFRIFFIIFPISFILTSIYWLLSSLSLYDLKHIENNQTFCKINSGFYLYITTFQFTLINILIYHFRRINQNPIEGILKPNKNVIIYIIICFVLSALVPGLSGIVGILGRSSFNTCFINTKYSGKLSYILFIPIFCIIIAIVQLIHDLFFMDMFSSDKKIRKIHKKNSSYAIAFCVLHMPDVIIILFSIFLEEINFDNNSFAKYFIGFSTYLTCLIPLIISIMMQFQGLYHIEVVNKYFLKKKTTKLLTKKTFRKLPSSSKEEPLIDSYPFEWLENHILRHFMRDILLGVCVSLQKSKEYNIDDNAKLSSKDFKKVSKHKINFENFKDYGLEDLSVDKSDYLNIKVIDYAPKCFSYLRQLENIDIDKMIESFLPKNNCQGIKESQGRSGSFFISTDDNKYMIKTLKPEELELLKHAFLKEYIEYIKDNPDSLLIRLYGMYNIVLGQGDEILIIVMRNVIGDFKDNAFVQFDLKGSTYKRKSTFDSINVDHKVMKDLNFNEFEKNILLSLSSIKRLREASEKDSKFLCKSELMDYSLFLVKLNLNKNEETDVFGDKINEKLNDDYNQIVDESNDYNRLTKKTSYRGRGKIHEVKHYKQYLFPSLKPGSAYIICIIDYFQKYNFFKYVECGIKTNFFQKKKKKIVSCVDPITYSSRFINYINTLSDVRQSLSDEIQEAKEENESEKSEEDSDDENTIFKRNKKININSENKQNGNEIIIPVDNSSDKQLPEEKPEGNCNKTD